MVDFDTNARLLGAAEIRVVAGSVDSAEKTAALGEGLRLGYVEMVSGLDPQAVAASTGAYIQDGERTFLHATGFLVRPDGSVAQSVYSSGPIGRFTANDILKKVAFDRANS